jgi:hypothetical protein
MKKIDYHQRTLSDCSVCIGFLVLTLGGYIIFLLSIVMSLDFFPIVTSINISDPFLSIFTSLLAISGGGLLSWRIQKWLTAPTLQPGSTGISLWRPHNFSEEEVIRLPIQNSGTKPANNCKAHIYLEFEDDSSLYRVETVATWTEQNYPNSIKINSQEVAYINIFKIQSDTEQILIPSSSTPEEQEGVILEYNKPADNQPPVIRNRIHPSILEDDSKRELFVRITSENANPIDIELKVENSDPFRLSIEGAKKI